MSPPAPQPVAGAAARKPPPRANVDAFVTDLGALLGDTVEVEARVDLRAGGALLIYSYDVFDAWLRALQQAGRRTELLAAVAAAENACERERANADWVDPDARACVDLAKESLDPKGVELASPCRSGGAVILGGPEPAEHGLTPQLVDVPGDPRPSCLHAVSVDEADVLRVGEPLLVVHYTYGDKEGLSLNHNGQVQDEVMLVLDPVDGHEIFVLTVESSTFGGTFGAGTRRELRFDPDGSFAVLAHTHDEAEAAGCEGTDAVGCGASSEVEGRYIWNAKTRTLDEVD